MKKFSLFLLALVLILACSTSALACTPWCGLNGPYFDTATPTEEELQLDALQRIAEDGDLIIGKYAEVHHYGNIRSNPNKYASSIGKTQHEDEFVILGYKIVDGKVWLRILYGNEPNAWISADLAEISGGGIAIGGGDGDGGGNHPYDSYIGKTCRIVVNSGRARMSADRNAPIIEYVGYGDKFTVLDVAASSPDNTLWFQIRKDGNLCWVSSGIATLNP